MALLVVLAAVGCAPRTRDNPSNCRYDDECLGSYCDTTTHVCALAGTDGGDGPGPEVRDAPAGDGGDGSGPDVRDAPTGDGGDAADAMDAVDAGPECTADPQCPTAAAPICDRARGVCVPCATGDECRAKDPLRASCGPGGACVECNASIDCTAAARPICAGNACAACMTDDECRAKDPLRASCGPGGACVECNASIGCTAAARPICTGNACVACMTDEECRMKDPQRGFCGPGGTCVECKTSLSCVSATQPICVANACVRCTRDQQCRDKEGADPGVCMSHEDGRCLTDPDTIYVRNNVLCPGNGRVTTPFCRPLDAMAALTVARKVVVIRGPDAVSGWSLMGLPAGVDRVTVVGQMGARVDGGGEPGVHVRGGARSYIRDLVFAGGGNVGVIADTGAEITLARCVVHDNAKGGILVDGAAFDISNTLVSQNGPGTYGSGVSWGGVLLQSAPVGRPARFAHNTVVDNMVMGLWCDGTYAVTGSIVSGSPLDPYMCSVAPCCAPGDPMLTSDYRLAPGSPCVDRVAPAAAPSDDLDGNPRPSPANGLSDCGAYELAR